MPRAIVNSVTRGGPLDLVEAAYRPHESERDWLGALAAGARPLLDRGLGVVAYTFRVQRGRFVIGEPVARGATSTAVATFLITTKLSTNRDLRSIYFGTSPCSTLGEFLGVERLTGDPVARTLGTLTGIVDFLAVRGVNPRGEGTALGVFLPELTSLDAEFRGAWERVAAHLAAARRLRATGATRSDGLPPGTEAVLEGDGRLVHAEGEARDSRESLAEAAKRIDRARARRDQGLMAWTALVEARWSLTDHFELDGRRLLVARKNAADTAELRGLSERERQVVGYCGLGHSQKLIAYELGLSESSVRTLERRAMRKLNVSTRVELVALLASLEWPCGSAPARGQQPR